MSKSKLKARNRYHLKKYEQVFGSEYEKLHNLMNKYVLSYKSYDDRFTADFHCTYNIFIFALCRLNLWSRNTKDPKKAFFSVLEDHIFSKAQHIGRDTINEKKFY